MKQITIKTPFLGVYSTLNVSVEDLADLAAAVALATETLGSLVVTRFGNVTVEISPAVGFSESPVVKKQKAAEAEAEALRLEAGAVVE